MFDGLNAVNAARPRSGAAPSTAPLAAPFAGSAAAGGANGAGARPVPERPGAQPASNIAAAASSTRWMLSRGSPAWAFMAARSSASSRLRCATPLPSVQRSPAFSGQQTTANALPITAGPLPAPCGARWDLDFPALLGEVDRRPCWIVDAELRVAAVARARGHLVLRARFLAHAARLLNV